MAEEQGQPEGGVENQLAVHGKLSYLEVPAIDVEALAQFYARVFGWTLRGDSNHRGFTDTSGQMIGAFEPSRTPSEQPGFVPYIYVEGVDATLERVKAHGGTVVREPYPEGGLWVATFRDPSGNLAGVWQAGGR